MTASIFTAVDDSSGGGIAVVLQQDKTQANLPTLACGPEGNLVRLILALVVTESAIENTAALRSRRRRNTGSRRSQGTA